LAGLADGGLMRKRSGVSCGKSRAIGLLALLTALSLTAEAAAQPLAERLAAVVAKQRGLRGAQVGVLVTRLADGEVLYAKSADKPMIPASNMKLLTAIAALDLFGPTHQFTTGIRAAAPLPVDGVVTDLAVLGGGDPVLNSEDWWRLAADLRRSGLTRIKGDLIVDDSAFDDEYWHATWGRVSSRAYHAPVAGLSANYGAFFVNVIPGSAKGRPVRVMLDPPIPYFKLVNAARTGGARAKQSLSVGRGRRTNGFESVSVSGVVRAGADADIFPRSVTDAGLYAGAVFAMQLEANGITIEGRVRKGDASKYATELIAFEGRPLSEIVRLFMKYSNNAIAETLVKAMGARASGAPGSWQNGLVAMRAQLEGLGLNDPALVIVDGSGLSPKNRITPRALVAALRVGSNAFDFGPELTTALPIAARDGTLERRARASKDHVRAKTGLLSDARATALSGYARLADGDRVAFSFVVNGYQAGTRAAMDGVDALSAALVAGPR
jgi:D-alanyl-D-alanine carboxypeptidase/D-alanyl-D-alanine-endopeptidase (penicillin-binding protein 4)